MKAATPFTAATFVVPLSVPDPALVPKPITTFAVDMVRLPLASSMRTVTAGVRVAPAVAEVGCWLNTSLAAAPGETLNGELFAAERPDAEAVSW